MTFQAAIKASLRLQPDRGGGSLARCEELRRPARSGRRACPQALAKKSVKAKKMAKPHILKSSGGLRIAVEGCCHGELDNIYGTLQLLEKREQTKIDLLICCGDFQAVRNLDDLECLACPPKYRRLNTFHKYHSGELTAPYPTLFIGGNHEASNYLWELYYGGWVAPNIYYLGHAGVVNFAGLRIAGLSGIFHDMHYHMGHWEAPPYQGGSMRSAYHIRQLEVYRLLQIQQPIDVFISHDWPRGIARHGAMQQLFKAKPFLQTEIERNSLGSPPGELLLQQLQPSFWFAAHLHVKFAALYDHSTGSSLAQPPAASSAGASLMPHAAKSGRPGARSTKFLALDKCLARRRFLQVVHFPAATGPHELSYDAEWLAILRGTHQLFSLQKHPQPPPGMNGGVPPRQGASQEDLQHVQAKLAEAGTAIPANFTPTAPSHKDVERSHGQMPRSVPRNPQTLHLLSLIDRPFNLTHTSGVSAPLAAAEPNPEEIELDDVDDDLDPDDPDMPGSPREAAAAVKNAEEIDIDDVAESEEESLDPG